MKSFCFLLSIIFIAIPECDAQKIERRAHQEVYNLDYEEGTFNFFRIDTLYSWTTSEQIEELRKDKILLKRSKSPVNGFSLFDRALRDSTLKGDTFAQILLQERFAKKRFAWSNGWATVRGWTGESYGHHLLKMVLKKEAIVGFLDRRYGSYRRPQIYFYDRSGNELSRKYVMDHQDLIAGVFHENEVTEFSRQVWKRKAHGTYVRDSKRKTINENYFPFREFVIVNENMISSWSYGTEPIKQEMRKEVEFLRQLMIHDKPKQKASSREAPCWDLWKLDRKKESSYFYSSLCFENDYYLYNKKAIQAIIDEMEIALSEQGAEITN